MEIRETQLDDALQWVRLKNTVWRSAYKDIMPSEVFEEQQSQEQDKVNNFIKNFDGPNVTIGYVAIDNGKLVALADATIISYYEYYKQKGYADLGALYILPEYQHMGLGKQLFDKVVAKFKSYGCEKMVIGVLKDNIQARRAYEKWGGVLDDHEETFEKLGVGYSEVFYIFDLKLI